GLSPMIPVWMQAANDIREQASIYFAIICIPTIFRVASAIFGTCIQAIKDTKTPMVVNLSENLLNVLLNALLIYGLSLGVTGAAIASAISYGLGGDLMTWLFLRKKEFG
ncbi:MAG: polysaccharide biosynthesis C-terminal domain-containing protein, partial [Lachnospiraceae bacterium]|nr:polysaccharide biosynthesis C-terminal domain-containing protein [Lachnospiraceae bacterium]